MSGEAAKVLVDKWLQENGFNEEGYTYIYFPKNSYDVKEELKAAGFMWHQFMLWHRGSAEGYEDKVVKVHKDEIMEFTVFGQPTFFANIKDNIQSKVKAARPQSLSEWVGQEKEKLEELPVTLTAVKGFQGQFGWTNIYTFLYDGKNEIVWFTSTDNPIEVNTSCLLSGTIKKHDTYNDSKVTIVTRCKIISLGQE